MRVCYPWSELEPGQGFFVPSLDAAKTRHEGLVAALHLRISPAKAIHGIRGGLIGVWFFIPPRQKHGTAPAEPAGLPEDGPSSLPGATGTPE